LNPMFSPYAPLLLEDNGIALSRTDLIADSTWYRSEYYRDFHSEIGVDELIFCHIQSPGRLCRYRELSLARAIGDRAFTARELTITRELHTVIDSQIGSTLAGFKEPSPSALSPRMREVLKCLLQGDGDKQIASRLGISPSTVNHYVKGI